MQSGEELIVVLVVILAIGLVAAVLLFWVEGPGDWWR